MPETALRSLNPTRLCLVLMACYVAMLVAMFGQDGGWLVESNGLRREVEFAGVRAAGDLVLAGKPAAAYDWTQHRQAQDAVIGQTSIAYFAWPYPPPYLAIAGLVAQLPYVAAAITFILVTAAFFAWSAASIAGRWQGALWALASPACYINASVAHTGFLLAGLLGLGLAWLPAYPIASGIAFGLLGVKPQLGLLLPIALAVGGYWRTFWSAAATVLLMYGASALAFGLEPWFAFHLQLEKVATMISNGGINMMRLVSFYGLARSLGADHGAAIGIHAVIATLPVLAIVQLVALGGTL